MLEAQISIRRATKADFAALEKIRNESAQSLSLGAVADLNSRLAAKGVFTYLAEDAQPFGFVSVGQSDGSVFDPTSTGEVLQWYLTAEKSHSGYGSKLLVRGLSVLKRRFFDTAVIWLPAQAIPAISILTTLGFENANYERIDNAVDGPIVSNAYVKDLGEYF